MIRIRKSGERGQSNLGWLDGHSVESGDGVAVSDESLVQISASQPSHFLLFDLA